MGGPLDVDDLFGLVTATTLVRNDDYRRSKQTRPSKPWYLRASIFEEHPVGVKSGVRNSVGVIGMVKWIFPHPPTPLPGIRSELDPNE